jgi:hypothetical protein
MGSNFEEKVKERTKELQEKNNRTSKRVAELVEFHRLTIARELKMIKLKKK